MGLFCMAMPDMTPEEKLDCVIGNIKIWKDYQKYPPNSCCKPGGGFFTKRELEASMLYVLEVFATDALNGAITQIKKRHKDEVE